MKALTGWTSSEKREKLRAQATIRDTVVSGAQTTEASARTTSTSTDSAPRQIAGRGRPGERASPPWDPRQEEEEEEEEENRSTDIRREVLPCLNQLFPTP